MMYNKHMKACPGGPIAIKDVVGRDSFIKEMWRVIDRQSVVLSAERRMGKTCVLNKMKAEAPSGTLAIYKDIESIRSPLEFADTVFQDVEKFLSPMHRTAANTRALFQKLNNGEIAGIIKFPETMAQHWKVLLTATVADLMQATAPNKVLLMWDEIPLMLDNIVKGSPEAAMELLDTLRHLRQSHPQLRMIFTGSVGLHHVLSKLKEAGYSNAPLNDMQKTDLEPLSQENATTLAFTLINGEKIKTAEPEKTARAIASEVDHIPFYIHHVVDALKVSGKDANPETALQMVKDKLAARAWDLQYYRERLGTYYAGASEKIALAILDTICHSQGGLPREELLNTIKAKLSPAPDEEAVRDTLDLLQLDYYIHIDSNRHVTFKFEFIRRWWEIARA